MKCLFFIAVWVMVGMWSGVKIIRERDDLMVKDLWFVLLCGALGFLAPMIHFFVNNDNKVLLKKKPRGQNVK